MRRPFPSQESNIKAAAPHSARHTRPRGPLSTRRGVSAVEAALVLPVLITILLGCADLARAIHVQLAVTNAVRVASEYGATHRYRAADEAAWKTKLHAVAREEAESISHFAVDDWDSEIVVAPEPNDGLRIEVSAAYQFRTIVNWPWFPAGITLRHAVAMRQYR